MFCEAHITGVVVSAALVKAESGEVVHVDGLECPSGCRVALICALIPRGRLVRLRAISVTREKEGGSGLDSEALTPIL